MKWGKFPFTNVIGERSIKFKPEGHEFVIQADKFGVRINGDSPLFQTNEELESLAKAIAEAFQSSSWYRMEKLGGMKNAVQVKSAGKMGEHPGGESEAGGPVEGGRMELGQQGSEATGTSTS